MKSSVDSTPSFPGTIAYFAYSRSLIGRASRIQPNFHFRRSIEGEKLVLSCSLASFLRDFPCYELLFSERSRWYCFIVRFKEIA